MTQGWQTGRGHLTCRWDPRHSQQNPAWMQEMPNIEGSYLEPVPDFASHSPFGGPSWFELHALRSSGE